MDPHANLARQRELVAEVMAIMDRCHPEDGDYQDGDEARLAEIAGELAELVQALDVWRKSGGFDPYAATAN